MIKRAKEYFPPPWLWKVGGGLMAVLFGRIAWKVWRRK